jgi:DNA-binding NarL/FixJ family response regulator
MSNAATYRIVVADDHPVVREGLVAMLETQRDFAIVGTAGTGTEALALVRSLEPDVLLLDLEMPELDGVGVLRELAAESLRTRAIMFTVFDTDERIISAVEAGAAGYLLKGAPRADVFAAVRVVANGGSLLAPLAVSAVLRRVRGDLSDTATARLTPREQQVLQLLAQGLANKQIAAQLRIAERTVKFHVSTVFEKLGATNRTDAVARAIQAKLIQL